MKIFRTLLITVMLVGALGFSEAKTVLGKLGQMVKTSYIYSSPTTRARIQYKVGNYTYLVLKTSTSKGWYRVLMQNGTYGYVRAEAVACLPYEVYAKEATPGTGSVSGDAGSFIAQCGLKFIGTPYKWGGNDINNGIDCSGFVKKLYGVIGKNLPRTAAQQVNVGTPITRLEDLRPGDRLYFWSSSRKKIGHTGIYIGNSYFVHASSSRHGVATDNIMHPRWRKILVAARR